ncbi:hypothetical protein LIER_34589 [Lithospermum erythrorhizon]|uniref:Uncharacterized protein n=1 Tax=Lithospermum erythrorhizon TaxID=34254 RepID=A0AAV3S4C5_LITER
MESFKKSPDFIDALGANVAYGAYSFVKKFKEKHPGLHVDYEKFQKEYDPSWFAGLDLDAPSEDEDDEKEAFPASDGPPQASILFLVFPFNYSL